MHTQAISRVPPGRSSPQGPGYLARTLFARTLFARTQVACLLVACQTMFFTGAVFAQETVPPPPRPVSPPPRQVSPEELAALGDAVSDLAILRANPFAFDEAAQRLQAVARSLEGGQTELLAIVRRIDRREVFVTLEDADRTQFALLHASPPWFGNLGTIRYESPLREPDLHVHASPVGLRIGSEIPLDQVRQALPGDVVRIQGRIVAMRVYTGRHLFNPSVSAIIGDWKVVEVRRSPIDVY